MIYNKDNRFGESTSPHSLALRNAMSVPNPGWDSNPLLTNQKMFVGAGMQGLGDITQFLSDPMAWLQTSDDTAIIPGLPNMIVVGAGLVAFWWLVTLHGREYKEEIRRVKSKHRGEDRSSGSKKHKSHSRDED